MCFKGSKTSGSEERRDSRRLEMADIAESGPDWSELSPSVQGAFEWAAAATVETLRSKADDQPMVVASALLFGIIMSHRGSSEPEALLEHFGRTRDQLFEALQRQVQESEPSGARSNST